MSEKTGNSMLNKSKDTLSKKNIQEMDIQTIIEFLIFHFHEPVSEHKISEIFLQLDNFLKIHPRTDFEANEVFRLLIWLMIKTQGMVFSFKKYTQIDWIKSLIKCLLDAHKFLANNNYFLTTDYNSIKPTLKKNDKFVETEMDYAFFISNKSRLSEFLLELSYDLFLIDLSELLELHL